MRKVVKVDDLISIAKNEVITARRYESKGLNDLASSCYNRAEAMRSLIAIASIKDTENFENMWSEIDNKIFC